MHSLTDYVSFIVLLTALFVIAGGIEVKGSLAGTPLANMVMLGIGAVLANLIGTTGAAMVLIRPYLRANASRDAARRTWSCSSSWSSPTPAGCSRRSAIRRCTSASSRACRSSGRSNLWLPWLFVNGVVLVIFNLVDQFIVNREERAKPERGSARRAAACTSRCASSGCATCSSWPASSP